MWQSAYQMSTGPSDQWREGGERLSRLTDHERLPGAGNASPGKASSFVGPATNEPAAALSQHTRERSALPPKREFLVGAAVARPLLHTGALTGF